MKAKLYRTERFLIDTHLGAAIVIAALAAFGCLMLLLAHGVMK